MVKADFFLAEDLSDLKRQVKLLEEKNTSYMQTNIELEEVGGLPFSCR